MKRRTFIKTGFALGSTALIYRKPPVLFSAPEQTDSGKIIAYKPGDKISANAFVLDKEMKRHTLLTICQSRQDVLVNLLYIFGGGAMGRKNKLGGIWCKDSFEDLQVLRFIETKYEEMPLQIIPVATSPIYSTQYYGFEERVLLDEPDDSEKFQEAAKAFIDSTEESYNAGFIPTQPYFDLRNRLLFNQREDLRPGKGYGKIYDWQGKFRAENETQKYGVPTIWFMDQNGVILAGPFRGNYYHSDPFEITYTLVDIDRALQKYF